MYREEKLKLILITGCPRSGTTMLNLLLNSHDNIAITNECNISKIVPKLIYILFKKEKAIQKKNYFRNQSSRETWSMNDLFKFIPRQSLSLNKVLYDWISSIKPNPELVKFIGDKTPRYYRENIHELQKQLNCDIYIIHITRNPLEVISSIMRRIDNSKKGIDNWSSITNVFEAIEEWIEAWEWRSRIKSEKFKFLDLNYNYSILNINDLTEKISEFLNLENKFDKSIVNSNSLDNFISKEKIEKIDKQFYKVISTWNDKNFYTYELDKEINELLKKRNKKVFLLMHKLIKNKLKLIKGSLTKKFLNLIT